MTFASITYWYFIDITLYEKSIFIGTFLLPGYCAENEENAKKSICSYENMKITFFIVSAILGLGAAVFFFMRKNRTYGLGREAI